MATNSVRDSKLRNARSNLMCSTSRTSPTQSLASTGSGYSRGDEGFEQPARPFMAGRQLLRVGLDPDDESVVGHLDTFDQAVLGRADGAQRRRDVAKRLVVKAVDLHALGADRARQKASRFELETVHQRVTRRAIMVARRSALDV